MSGWVILLVGVVLCFFGVGSVHLALLASGFGVGWLLADVFNASTGVALLIGLGGALIAWAVVTLVFKVARFVVGVIVGSIIGAKLYAIFDTGSGSVVLAIVVVVATAIVFGFLADRYRGRVLVWATAIGGAGLILSSLGVIWPSSLGFLRNPNAGTQQWTSTLIWIALTAAGWLTQRRLFAKRLNLERANAQ
jgi:hypothetical protein